MKIRWESDRDERTSRKRIVLATSMGEAIENLMEEEKRPWRRDMHGSVRPADQIGPGW